MSRATRWRTRENAGYRKRGGASVLQVRDVEATARIYLRLFPLLTRFFAVRLHVLLVAALANLFERANEGNARDRGEGCTLENKQERGVQEAGRDSNTTGEEISKPRPRTLTPRAPRTSLVAGPERLSDRTNKGNTRIRGTRRTTKIMTGTATMRWTSKLWLSFFVLSFCCTLADAQNATNSTTSSSLVVAIESTCDVVMPTNLREMYSEPLWLLIYACLAVVVAIAAPIVFEAIKRAFKKFKKKTIDRTYDTVSSTLSTVKKNARVADVTDGEWVERGINNTEDIKGMVKEVRGSGR